MKFCWKVKKAYLNTYRVVSRRRLAVRINNHDDYILLRASERQLCITFNISVLFFLSLKKMSNWGWFTHTKKNIIEQSLNSNFIYIIQLWTKNSAVETKTLITSSKEQLIFFLCFALKFFKSILFWKKNGKSNANFKF